MKTNEKDTELKDRVSSLYELMKTEKLEELEIKDASSYIYLKRKGKTQKPQAVYASQAPAAVEQAPAETAEKAAAAGDTVKSPITGIFYRAPSPSSPSFVKEGDTVGAGKTLCIVEAMKVMNEVKSETGMKILKILVENGKPITAAEDLFLIEKL
jgi:acetyl-CoA carboxylase biotin carboxyl carrier protein